MTTRDQTIAEALDRLFRTYPSSGQGETAGDILRERIERAKVYFEAVEPYRTDDIEAGVKNFLTGSAPGHNPAFAPSAPQLAAEVRRVMNLRLDSEARERARRPALPKPDIIHSPESQERVKALAEQAINRLASSLRTEDAAKTKRQSERLVEHDARFIVPGDAAMARRLGYSVGAPEADRNAA